MAERRMGEVLVFSEPGRLWSYLESALPSGGVIGVSGFGGAGKTTLSIAMGRDRPGVQLVHVDDYLDWPTVCSRNGDGAGIGFDAIQAVQIEPLRAGRKPVSYLIVEGIFLFSAERQSVFDKRVWVDTPVDALNATGQARDPQNQALWETVWLPNELEFERKHQPQQYADVHYRWFGG